MNQRERYRQNTLINFGDIRIIKDNIVITNDNRKEGQGDQSTVISLPQKMVNVVRVEKSSL